MVQVPTAYRGWVKTASSETGLPYQVVANQINDESGFRPDVTSPAGAEGIAQFEPGTYAAYGPEPGSPYNVKDALIAYVAYMRNLLAGEGGSVRKALAAYNAGPANLPAGYGYADTILQQAGEPLDLQAGQGGVPPGAGKGLNETPYRNPFRDAQITAERIDEGVDYGGTGPVYALGPGRITYSATGSGTGWGPPAGGAPGGYIKEQITQGPLQGQDIYVAEGVQPSVRAGQSVTSATQIGTLTGTGIETGFAAPGPGTAAMGAGQFTGSNSTAWGSAYSTILHDLGAPAGIAQGSPSGSLPGWLDKLLKGGVFGLAGAGAAGDNPLTGLDGIAQGIGQIGTWLGSLSTAVDWLISPTHWVRIFCGIGGGAMILSGAWWLSHTGGEVAGLDIPRPAALPLGIAFVGAGGILLFLAFHNLPATVTDMPSMLGYLQQSIQAGSAAKKS